MKPFILRNIVLTIFCFADLAALAQTDIFEIVRGGSLQDLQTAISAGVDVNVRDEYGVTPLMIAVDYEQFELIKPLLDAGADADARNVNGWSALTYTLRDTDPEIIQMLRTAGPKAAAQEDFFKLLEYGSLAEIKAVLTDDIDLTAYDSGGYTTLMRASAT